MRKTMTRKEPSATDPSQHIDKLDIQHKRALAGVIACLLACVRDGTPGKHWTQGFFLDFIEQIVRLPNEVSDAYMPLLQLDEGDSMQDASKRDKDVADNMHTASTAFLRILPEGEIRFDLLRELLWKCALHDGYDSRERTLFRFLSSLFGIPWKQFIQEENRLGLKLYAELTGMQGNRGKSKRSFSDWKRNAKIGAAAVTGATLLAVTGGIAAPAIAAGFTALGGSGVAIGTAFASASGIAATTAVFGAAGAGLAGYKVDRRTLGVRMFEFDLVSAGDGMNVTICVSGWISNQEHNDADFRRPWGDDHEYLREFYRQRNPAKIKQVDAMLKKYKGREKELFSQLHQIYSIPESEPLVSFRPAEEQSNEQLRAWQWRSIMPSGDQFCLRWEKDVLERFGKALWQFVATKALDLASQEVIKQTIFASLYVAVALPTAIIKAADMIDSDWTIALERADEAGRLLARILLSREQGSRPVTLIGYSMGARLIFSCLKALAAAEQDACGIIENAVLLGAVVSENGEEWDKVSSVVSGRLVNGFSKNDWILAIMYRYQGWAINVCGIDRIDSLNVENIDLSDIINSHMDYPNKMHQILDILELEK